MKTTTHYTSDKSITRLRSPRYSCVEMILGGPRPYVLLLFVPFFLVLFCSSLFAAQLENLSWESSSRSTRVTLTLDGAANMTKHILPATKLSPQRFYLDVESTLPSAGIPRFIRVEDGRLDKIRIGLHQTSMRIVFDIGPDQSCLMHLTNGAEGGLIVDVIISEQPRKSMLESPSAVGVMSQETETVVKRDFAHVDEPPVPEEPSVAMETEPVFQRPEESEAMFSLWGELFGYTAQDLENDGYDDDALSHVQARVGGELEQDLSSGYVLQGRVGMEFDRLYYDADEADEDTEVRLYEGYLLLTAPSWDVSLGKQRVRWGKSDQLSPLDSLNPEDLRQFMTLDLEERKDPSWLARLRTYGETFTFEAVVSPWFEESDLDYFDSDWALYRNLRQTILSHPDIPAALKSYAEALRVHEREPSDSVENMSGAVRLLWQTERADFALSYRYGWETLPTIVSFPVKNIRYDGDPETDPTALLATAVFTDEMVEARYNRQKIAGFEWETVLDLIGLRGEIAYIDKISFLASDLTSTRHDVGHLVTGIDYTSEEEWYFNLQTSWMHIFDYDKQILYFEQDNVALLGEIRKPIWRGNLEFATRYNYTLTDGSSYVQPSMTLKYFPNTACELGINLFSGDGDTLLGSYDQADQVYMRLDISL